MNWPKIFGWGFVIFAAWFIYTNPHGAAAAVTAGLNALRGVGNTLSVFFTSL